MTDPWRTPERLALRELVADFTTREIAPHIAAWEEAGEVPRALHAAAAKVGLLGAGFDEEVGGSGGDAIDALIVAEQIILSGGSGGLVAALITHGIALPHIVAAGDPELIDRFVRPTLAGEHDRRTGHHRTRRRVRRRRADDAGGARRRRVRGHRRQDSTSPRACGPTS